MILTRKNFHPYIYPIGTLVFLSRVTGDEERMRPFPHPHPNKQPPEGGTGGEGGRERVFFWRASSFPHLVAKWVG